MLIFLPDMESNSLIMPRIFGDIQEGYGANVIGGNGGRVVRVRNLNDGGFGSLRHYVGLNEPRIIRFDVAGNIELESPIVINNPELTIDGSDAPCGGICLKNEGIQVRADEVIVKYLRVRPGPDAIDPDNNDCIQFINVNNGLVSNCSLSWSTDELLTISGSRNVTVQWCILSEALRNSTHSEQPHSMGLFVTSTSDRVSIHHNLIAHVYFRNPTIESGNADVRNNIIYNPRLVNFMSPIYSAIHANWVGNWRISGADTSKPISLKIFGGPFTASSEYYLFNNRDATRINDDMDEARILDNWPVVPDNVIGTEFDMPHIRTTDAPDALEDVIAYAGAMLPIVDPIDLRIKQDVIYVTGQIIDDPSEVGGWPELVDLNCRSRNVFSWIGGLKN